jgi:hypothetical protein
MKFDVTRAMAWVQAFDFARCSECAGESEAADLLAERLTHCGWHVERSPVRAEGRCAGILMLLGVALVIESYSLWSALRHTFPRLALAVRVLLACAGLAVIAVLARATLGWHALPIVRERVGGCWTRRSRARKVNVVASWPAERESRSRVVFLSHLDTSLSGRAWEFWIWSVGLGMLLALARSGLPAPSMAWVWVAIWLGTFLGFLRVWLRPGTISAGDNRSGLAFISELAQAIPDRLHDRLEIRLAAVGSNSAGQLGALVLAKTIKRRWPTKPTLVVNVDAPGLGTDVVLVGRGPSLELARAAAKDLWLPYTVARWPWRALDHRPFLFYGIDGVSLAGDRNARRIDPARLSATAQLAEEIALRWARDRAGGDQGASLAKSSQKPG